MLFSNRLNSESLNIVTNFLRSLIAEVFKNIHIKMNKFVVWQTKNTIKTTL